MREKIILLKKQMNSIELKLVKAEDKVPSAFLNFIRDIS